MDNPFFEQFMDLDQLFPELPLVDTLKLEFEVEQASPVVPSDICQSDVVTAETDECIEVASPFSDVIDVVTVESDAEVPSLDDDISDMALSPEYTVVTVHEGSFLPVDDSAVSVETLPNLLDCDQAEPTSQHAAEEITVIETSDSLTLLTQELTQTSSFPDNAELPPSTLTVDLDELFTFSATLGLPDSVLPGTDDSGESEAGPCEVSVEPKPQAKRKRACSSESSNTPTKKAKSDDDDVSCCSELDRRTIRRLKNNVASKHARAARKQKEHELFKQEAELEKSNAELRKQLQELELLTTSLRKVLVERLSGVTCPV